MRRKDKEQDEFEAWIFGESEVPRLRGESSSIKIVTFLDVFPREHDTKIKGRARKCQRKRNQRICTRSESCEEFYKTVFRKLPEIARVH